MLAGEVAVVGHGHPEQQLRVGAWREADLEGAELIGPVGLDLDGLAGEAVQRHQPDQRVRSVGPAPEPAGDRRRVDGVVEVGVADEHPDHLSRGDEKRSSAFGSGSVGRRSSKLRSGARREVAGR